MWPSAQSLCVMTFTSRWPWLNLTHLETQYVYYVLAGGTCKNNLLADVWQLHSVAISSSVSLFNLAIIEQLLPVHMFLVKDNWLPIVCVCFDIFCARVCLLASYSKRLHGQYWLFQTNEHSKSSHGKNCPAIKQCNKKILLKASSERSFARKSILIL